MPTLPSTSDRDAGAPRRIVPIALAAPARADDCSGAEPFALQVLGEDMLPEFAHGDIVVVEPEGLACDGAYVIANWQGDWLLRQLRREGEGWVLATPDSSRQPISIPDLAPVRGVVIQKSVPGRRRATKRYVD